MQSGRPLCRFTGDINAEYVRAVLSCVSPKMPASAVHTAAQHPEAERASHTPSRGEKLDILSTTPTAAPTTAIPPLHERTKVRLTAAFFALLTLGWGDGGEVSVSSMHPSRD